MRNNYRIAAALMLGLLAWSPMLATAQSADTSTVPDTATVGSDASAGSLKQDIDALNAQVKSKQDHIKTLDANIQNYKQQINDQEQAVTSLQNEVAMLDNTEQEKQLAVERTQNQMDLANLEIQSYEDQIKAENLAIDNRMSSLSELLRTIQDGDQVSQLDIFLNKPSLSEFFVRVDQLKNLNADLYDATQALKADKDHLDALKKEQEAQRLVLVDQKTQLEKDQQELDGNRSAKISLISETQSKEEEFQRILYELRQDQQDSSTDISGLEDKLKSQLDSVDTALARGDILLNWPIPVLKGISAHFHDPNYPFRKFFEHPGIDLPTNVGTPVHAAAGGYVAWTRTGKQYGNYIMLVHPGGIATIYAHLIRFAAKPDTYVERGDIIGYSGGRPGDEGAGLSTGAHLHFEVRRNGIPVNPEPYLPSLDN